MARYDWPREFRKSPDRLVHRAEHAARSGRRGVTAALTGDLDLLDDVIQANFQEDRMWLPLGPSILINGQAKGNPVVSGRVRDIRISPNGQRIYVGTANGGVWYSADTGLTWTPLGSWGLAAQAVRSGLSLTIGALLVEFGQTGGADDPAKDVVYVGTGEAQPYVKRGPGGHHGGIGILRLNGTLPASLTAPGRNPWTREARNLTGAGIYRLARNPTVTPALDGSATLVAATSTGLWSRSGAFAEDADWQRVEFAPRSFASYATNAYCSDVVWNDRGLWVTLVDTGVSGHDGVYRSTNGLAGPFTAIALPNLKAGARLSLGEAPHATTRMYVLGKRPSPTTSPTDPARNKDHAHLWQIDVSTAAANVREVQNFPVGLFVSKVKLEGGNLIITEYDQSEYDQAIAVRQVGGNDVVTAGGSLELIKDWNAALFDLTITTTGGNLTTNFSAANQTNPAGDATFIGAGIHPDVHFVQNNFDGVTHSLWVGCDGGVFRRFGGNNRSMNAGLATAETGIIASHPTLDGPILAGTHDNGVIQRIGDTLWTLQRKGDGGGCLFHPTKPHQTVMQYIRAVWQFEPDTFIPPGPAVRYLTGSRMTTSEASENKRALFYSKAATAKINADDARLFIGTDRIWYSANWNTPGTQMDWVTIPTLSDPHNARINQDRLTEGGSRSEDPVNVIEIIREGDAGRKFDGLAILVLCKRTVRIFRYAHPNTSAGVGTWTPVADSIVSDRSGVDRPKTKKTGGDDVPNPFVDYLPRKRKSAWTDIAVHTRTNGSETFYVTTTGQVTIASDGTLSGDQHYDTCWWYNGAGRWYPTGLRNTPLNAGSGTGGSPAAAHSVIVDPNDDRIVYVGNRIGVWEGLINTGGTHPSWTWKPAMEGLPQTVVEDLSIFKEATRNVTFLRAALVSRGVWERDISPIPLGVVGRTFIRSLPYDTGRIEMPEAPVDALTNAALDYHSSPDIVLLTSAADRWVKGTLGMPNEADLHSVKIPSSFSKAEHVVYVMVHHRHTTAIAGADIDINVFLQKNAPTGGISGFAINDAWRTAIWETVNGNSPAMPTGLEHVGLFHPDSPVDARTPRAVSFPLDLRFAGSNDHLMLIAVVTSPNNTLPPLSISVFNNLKDLVQQTPNIAVRKFRRTT